MVCASLADPGVGRSYNREGEKIAKRAERETEREREGFWLVSEGVLNRKGGTSPPSEREKKRGMRRWIAGGC